MDGTNMDNISLFTLTERGENISQLGFNMTGLTNISGERSASHVSQGDVKFREIVNNMDVYWIPIIFVLGKCGERYATIHDKQTSSQRKCREHLSNQPSHRDNVTHQ